MKFIFIVIILFFLSDSFAQKDSLVIVEFPEIDASFPGGPFEMLKFIQNNIEYSQEMNCDYSKKVYISFIVSKDGKISNITILRGFDEAFNTACISLLKKMPDWNPAFDQGIAVNSKVLLPISIHLK